MPTLAEQVRRRAHVYVAHGGKTNRRQQVDRLVIMVSWMQAEFRLTGIEQIGNCAGSWWSWGMSEWSTVTLADIADIRFSNVDKKSLAGEKSVRLCNYMDTYSNNYITADLPFMEATATALEMERFKVEKGDNIITKDSETPDDIGIPAVVIDDIPNLICGYHLALIKPKRDKVDPIYLSKQLGSQQSSIYFSKLANGSTRYGLSSSAIASIKIPLAPFVEQRRIAFQQQSTHDLLAHC